MSSLHTPADHVLLLPGWHNSGPGHWQTHWEAQQGYVRVEQHDWERPLRGDWSTRLEEVVLTRPGPVVLVAHSLGCLLVAAWAALSRNRSRVKAALLVAPGDAEQPSLQTALHSWSPIARQRLPFPSLLVASQNDPFCSFTRAQALASAWGAAFHDLGAAGHINADSGLGAWPEGHALLKQLLL
jgi:predicted alpha/beta hydrolase family esterase